MAFVNESQRWVDKKATNSEIPISYTKETPSHLLKPDIILPETTINKNKPPFNVSVPRFDPIIKEPIKKVRKSFKSFDEFGEALADIQIMKKQKQKLLMNQSDEVTQGSEKSFEDHPQPKKASELEQFTKMMARDDLVDEVYYKLKDNVPGPGHYFNEPHTLNAIIKIRKSQMLNTLDDECEQDKWQILKQKNDHHQNDLLIAKHEGKAYNNANIKPEIVLQRHKSSHQINRYNDIAKKIIESKSDEVY